jgi:hypothetical protein
MLAPADYNKEEGVGENKFFNYANTTPGEKRLGRCFIGQMAGNIEGHRLEEKTGGYQQIRNLE